MEYVLFLLHHNAFKGIGVGHFMYNDKEVKIEEKILKYSRFVVIVKSLLILLVTQQ